MRGLTEYEKFLLLRPLPAGWPKDDFGTPFIQKNNFSEVCWDSIGFSSFANLKSTKDQNKKILLHFQYDKTLYRIWNNPLKYINKFKRFFAVTTPDFSAYRNMDHWVVEENVRHSLWLGAWYQYFGLNVIPTVTWAGKDSFDICFNYIGEGSVVAISTVGISKYRDDFLLGFNEMIKRIKPPLVLVRGKPLEGMHGSLKFIDFDEHFERSIHSAESQKSSFL